MYITLILTLQFIIGFIFFRKKNLDYDKIANITLILLTGIPLSIVFYYLNNTFLSLYFFITSLTFLVLYLEYVSYATKKDPGYKE